MIQDVIYLILGLAAGALSGFFGIGGGVVVVPALVLLFGMTQLKAQGTMLAAFLPPVAFLAFWKYYKSGNTDIRIAIFIAIGVFIGGYLGALASHSISETVLRKFFGVMLLAAAAHMIFGK